jgi:hypothetical protein
MMSRRTASLGVIPRLAILVSALAGSACNQREASAQVTVEPLGPIYCFQAASTAQLDDDHAVTLCTNALTDAPGRCYAVAINQFHDLSQQQILQLCFSSTSLQPISCYARLDALGTLTEDQAIAYCATTCSVGPPPPQASNPACLDMAVRYTNLALQTAGELCRRSRDAGPVQCFMAGKDNLHNLSESKLVSMCTQSARCQYEYGGGTSTGTIGGGYGY